MAKVKVFENMVVIKSDILTNEAIENAKLFNEGTLVIKDEETNDVRFSVGTGETNSFTRFGAIFNEGETKNIITIPSGKDEAGKKAYIRTYLVPILIQLQKVEDAIAALGNVDIDVDIDFLGEEE